MEHKSLKDVHSLVVSQLNPSTYIQTSPYYYAKGGTSSMANINGGGIFRGGDGGGSTSGGLNNSESIYIQSDLIGDNYQERNSKRTHSSAIKDKSRDKTSSMNNTQHFIGTQDINQNSWIQSGTFKENEKISQIQKIYNNNLPRSRQQQHFHNKSPSHFYNTHSNTFFNPNQLQPHNSSVSHLNSSKRQRHNSNLSQSPNQQPQKKYYPSTHNSQVSSSHNDSVFQQNTNSNKIIPSSKDLNSFQQIKPIASKHLKPIYPSKMNEKRDSDRSSIDNQIPQTRSALVLPPPPQKRSSIQTPNSINSQNNRSTSEIINSAEGSKFYQTEPHFHKKSSKRLLQIQKPPQKQQLVPILDLMQSDNISNSTSLTSGRKYVGNSIESTSSQNTNKGSEYMNVNNENNQQKWSQNKWNIHEENKSQRWNSGEGSSSLKLKVKEGNVKNKWIVSEDNYQRRQYKDEQRSSIDNTIAEIQINESEAGSKSQIEEESKSSKDVYRYEVEMSVSQTKKKKDKIDYRTITELEVIEEQNREEEVKEVPHDLLEQVKIIAQARPKTSEGGRRRIKLKQQQQKQEQQQQQLSQQKLQDGEGKVIQEKKIENKPIASERKKREILDLSPLQSKKEEKNEEFDNYYEEGEFQDEFEQESVKFNSKSKPNSNLLFRSQAEFFTKKKIVDCQIRPSSEQQNQQQRMYNLYKFKNNMDSCKDTSRDIPLEIHVQDENEDYIYQQESDGKKKKIIQSNNNNDSSSHKIIIRHNKSAAGSARKNFKVSTIENNKAINSLKGIKVSIEQKPYKAQDDVTEREIVKLETGLDCEFINLFASPLQP